MVGDTPQAPVAQKVQPEIKNVSQTPQQPAVVPQTPSPPAGESTPPPKPKKGLKMKKIILFLVFMPVLILIAYGIFIAVTYWNCSKTTPQACETNTCGFSLSGFNLASEIKEDCCGNEICETGEVYPECIDCPNCDDENECTSVDSYDYNKHECVNEPILDVVCCGNTLCEEGHETNSDCPKDCPSCDDENRLTIDSFSYETQVCENVATHYFIDDFEEGTENWVFSDETAWSTIIEGGNTVLKGTNPGGGVYARLENKSWANYIFKVRFKIINGGMHFHYRLNPSYVAHVGDNNVILGLEKEEEIVKQYPLDKNWHTLEIKCYGSIINVYVDDELLIKYKYTENLPISNGIELRTMGGSGILIDDVEIEVISEEDIVYP